MILTTTGSIDGRTVAADKGIVVGEAIKCANIVRDFFASVTDVVSGRSGACDSKLREARAEAMAEIKERSRAAGVQAVIGTDPDHEVVGGPLLMVSVSVSGTTVTLS